MAGGEQQKGKRRVARCPPGPSPVCSFHCRCRPPPLTRLQPTLRSVLAPVDEKPNNPHTAVSRDSSGVTSLSLGSASLLVCFILGMAVPGAWGVGHQRLSADLSPARVARGKGPPCPSEHIFLGPGKQDCRQKQANRPPSTIRSTRSEWSFQFTVQKPGSIGVATARAAGNNWTLRQTPGQRRAGLPGPRCRAGRR